MRARLLFLWLAAMASPSLLSAQGDLPSMPPGERAGNEPSLILSDLPDIPLPPPTAARGDPPKDLLELETAVRRARENAASSQRLWKAGVLAKVEVERKTLRAIYLENELAAARWRVASEKAARARQQMTAGGVTAAEAARADDEAEAAEQTACEASLRWQRAQVEAAAINLWRKQQLHAAGIGSKADVQRAERQLAALRRQGE